MKIIIPMSGNGSRFVNAGYKNLKPLIEIDGKPIIEWIVKGMYKEDDDFLFICRKEHLENIEGMRQKIESLAPNIKIYEVENWNKKGPVWDVLKAECLIDDKEPCIINYCDFYCVWDYDKFVNDVKKNNCDGAVPCYTSFHPHLLISTNYYASCKTNEDDFLIEIREKYSFENDKTKAKHSPGIYYFKNGHIMKKYCKKLIAANDQINNEFYASLPYNYMIKDGLKVWIPTCIDKFCQWGTPYDLKEYLFWIDIFKEKDKND